MMQQLQLLLEKYGNGTLSEQEEKTLLELLSAQEPSLKAWAEQAYQNDIKKEAVYLTKEHSNRLLQQIQEKKRSRPRIAYKFVFTAAAAVLLLVAGIQWFRYAGNSGKSHRINPIVSVPAQRKLLHNTGKVAISYRLPDSSVATLHPGGVLAYNEPFNGSRRELFLQRGKAMFTVASDPERPFTVYAGTTATTALGTTFTVAEEPANKVVIQLHSGKVVVRSDRKNWQDVYLKPGEQAAVDAAAATCKVSHFKLPASGATLSSPATEIADEKLVFRKIPLEQLFKQLGKKYNITIFGDAAELQGLVFTGRFSDTDSLQAILSVITGLNNLSSHKGQDTIFIHKEK